MYKYIFIDLDDTLFDFQKSEHLSIQQLLSDYQLETSPEMIQSYKTYNQSLWHQIEQGNLTKDQLLNTRFPGFFKSFDIEISDGIAVDNQFRSYLVQNTFLLPDALTFLKTLKKHQFKLYAASNGVYETQFHRLHLTEIYDLFDDYFISEKIGFAKPDPRFFTFAFNQLNITDLSQVVMIGDSLSSDIQGANNANIDVIWLNQQAKELPSSLKVIYQTSHLKDVMNYLINDDSSSLN